MRAAGAARLGDHVFGWSAKDGTNTFKLQMARGVAFQHVIGHVARVAAGRRFDVNDSVCVEAAWRGDLRLGKVGQHLGAAR
jgi:hypothetical protein